ncbi:MAG: hypothetical protein RL497_2765 [Pseudomonadota bacterium]|jgi:methyltransferase-like protein/SAM-dependent methyltransferase
MNSTPATAYDQVIYPNYTYPQTHPRRLAALAQLLGLAPALPSQCRVLELGCGDGGNLIPIAFSLPGSECLGVDIASQLIADGNQRIESLGLTNIQLRTADLAVAGAELGQFDFIICHGIYSWVPDFVRDNILAICRLCLAPQGVAYISYNAYPGFHLRAITRSILQFHTRGINEANEKARQSRSLVNWLAQAQTPGDTDAPMSAYSTYLQEANARFSKKTSGAIYHDDLSEENKAFYFHEFAEAAAKHGLQYLIEANFSDTQDSSFAPEVRAQLAQLGTESILTQEQYLDYLTGRNFRQTLLCHHNQTLKRPILPLTMQQFYFCMDVQPETPITEFNNDNPMRFIHSKQGALTTNNPLAKAALTLLGRYYPQVILFKTLLEESILLLEDAAASFSETGHDELAEFLFNALSMDMLEIHTQMLPLPVEPGEHPKASSLARAQAHQSPLITSLLHHTISLDDPLSRALLLLLDGTRNRAALVDALSTMLQTANNNEQDKKNIIANLPALVEHQLARLLRLGLLME